MSTTIGLETLKFQLLQSFRTGNLILDTILAGLIISCSGFIFDRLRLLINFPLNLSSLKDLILRRKTHEIVIRGQKIQTGTATRNEFSQKFKAVLHQVKNLDFKEADINKIEEVESCGGCIGLVRQRHPFKFTPDVFGKMEVETDESESETPVRIEKYTVRVFSSPKDLKSWTSWCRNGRRSTLTRRMQTPETPSPSLKGRLTTSKLELWTSSMPFFIRFQNGSAMNLT